MVKGCSNCYWRSLVKEESGHCWHSDVVPKEGVCRSFKIGCDCGGEYASYTLNGEHLCDGCLEEKLGIEAYAVTHYQLKDGSYLGSECDDIVDIYKCANSSVVEIDY